MSFPISIQDISYSYVVKGFEPNKAINNVSIKDIKSGQIIAIYGPNGCGKSTFLNYIVGKLPNTKPLLNKIILIPQQPSLGLVPDLSIIENLVYRKILLEGLKFKKYLDPEKRKKVASLCSELGYPQLIKKFDHPPIALSGGEQQILNMISVIIAEPELILLDEPTSKLDDINKIKIYNLIIAAVNKTNAAVIVVSHDIEYIDRIADRKVRFESGSVVEDKIIREPHSPRQVAFIRLFEKFNDLPSKFQNLKMTWWKPDNDGLFSDDYYVGDDSRNGYLAKCHLARNSRTIREVNGVIQLFNIGSLRNIKMLDVPCGWGRHSIEFAKLGYEVTGVDICEKYLFMASKRAKAQNISVRFILNDMRKLNLQSDYFDFVVNLWTSFGFFENEDNERVIEEFARVTKKNGKIIIHTDLNPNRVKFGIFDEPAIRKLQNGNSLEVVECYCAENGFVYGSWKLSNKSKEHLYRIKLYTELDWMSLAQRYGLKVESFLGSLDINVSNVNALSQEFIVVLTKI